VGEGSQAQAEGKVLSPRGNPELPLIQYQLFKIRGFLMERSSVVFIPRPAGGNSIYEIAATSSFEAARRAIAGHEKHHPRLSDDVVVHVVFDGNGPKAFDYVEHNARQPNYRHRVWGVMVFETMWAY
jgi:hypothetical protein